MDMQIQDRQHRKECTCDWKRKQWRPGFVHTMPEVACDRSCSIEQDMQIGPSLAHHNDYLQRYWKSTRRLLHRHGSTDYRGLQVRVFQRGWCERPYDSRTRSLRQCL